MGKVWVLDTGTKGTGAEMVPLDKMLEKPAPSFAPPVMPGKPRPRPAKAGEVREAWRFKVVDAMTRQVLAEGADARETVRVLEGIRSIVDVSIYLWEPRAERWRPLTLREKNAIWAATGSHR